MARTVPTPHPVPEHHPRIAHFMPYLKGDSIKAIALAFFAHFLFIDQNVQDDREGGLWVLHWGRWKKQWRWIWTGEYDARGREIRVRCRYKRDKIHQLSPEQVSRLRSKRRGGFRPRTLREHMLRCAFWGITLCAEFKFTVTVAQAEQVATDAIETGCKIVAMRLSNVAGGIRGAYLTLSRLANAGVAGALLPRGRKPADWETAWVPLGIKCWGRWRRRGV